MDFLVAKKTVGYGPCLEFAGTSPRHLNLVPLMHQIRAVQIRCLYGICAVTFRVAGIHRQMFRGEVRVTG